MSPGQAPPSTSAAAADTKQQQPTQQQEQREDEQDEQQEQQQQPPQHHHHHHELVEHRLSVSFAEDQFATSSPQRSHATASDVPSMSSFCVAVDSTRNAASGVAFPSASCGGAAGRRRAVRRDDFHDVDDDIPFLLLEVRMDSDEEYSASISAVMSKRQLTAKKLTGKRRRGSVASPTPDVSSAGRRHSSVFTLSEWSRLPVSQPSPSPAGLHLRNVYRLLLMVRLHRDVLREVRAQPLPLRRKIRLLLKRCHRELSNMARALIPWEKRIKGIEAQFGSVVASYFVFLRWLCLLNVGIAAIFVSFVMVPEILSGSVGKPGDARKTLLPNEVQTAYDFSTLWNFEGVLRMATNARASKLSAGGEEAVFSWKLFAGWDFTVGHPEAAINKRSALLMSFRELLLEEKEKTKQETGWKLVAARVVANLLILGLLATSAYAIVLAVERSYNVDPRANWFRQNELQVVLGAAGFIFPNLSGWIGKMEKFHPRAALRWQLARILALFLVNFYSLIPALFKKVDIMIIELEQLRTQAPMTEQPGTSYLWTTLEPTITTAPPTIFPTSFNTTECSKRRVPCASLRSNKSDLITDKEYWSQGNGNISDLLAEFSIVIHEDNFSRTYFTPEVYPKAMMNETSFLKTWDPEVWRPDNTTTTLHPDFIAKLDKGMRDAAEAYARWRKVKQRIMDERNRRRSKRQIRFPFSNNKFFIQSAATEAKISSITDASTELPTTDDTNTPETTQTRFSESSDISSSTEGGKGSSVDTETTWSMETSDTTGSSFDEQNRRATSEKPERCFIQLCFSATQTVATTESTRAGITTEKIGCYYEDDGTPASPEIQISSQIREDKHTPNAAVVIESDPRAGDETRRWPVGFRRGQHHQQQFIERIDETKKKNPVIQNSDPVKGAGRGETRMSEYLQSFFSEIRFYPKIADSDTYSRAPANPWDTTYNVSQVSPTSIPKRRILCAPITTPAPPPPTTIDYKPMQTLRSLCWETMLGQELVKITVIDLVTTLLSTLVMDFVRALIVRFLNPCWFWDLEKRWPEYAEFNVAESVLHLVNNQGMIWMGMFFSPGLPVLNLLKLVVLAYARFWIVTTCNVPHETVFRASRSNNFYYGLLLLFLFLCTLPVGYFVVRLPPSWHCGPFSGYDRIYMILTRRIMESVPQWSHVFLDYMTSAGVVIPLLVLLTLFIYYLLSLAGALREANDDLRIQLRRERTEERRKMFKLAEKRDTIGEDSKWNVLLPALKSRFSSTSSRSDAEKEERAKGMCWPREAMLPLLGYVSSVLPQTYGTDALRNVMSRGYLTLAEDWFDILRPILC
ncbi:unnamed protein product [Notodromas monacha]|uniref:TMC domain-containing protein n=1 Tax=Notodromas monacha TaxID=399045 RepID=A0A7R9BJN6_9CRUS|nr:unnamed protein product [Notodromas monacha]CAG0915903.1 unnamed protein product [Notodromas monacha]